MAVQKIKTLTIGDTKYQFDADNATQQNPGFMSAEDKTKVDDLTAITENEINEIFGAL